MANMTKNCGCSSHTPCNPVTCTSYVAPECDAFNLSTSNTSNNIGIANVSDITTDVKKISAFKDHLEFVNSPKSLSNIAGHTVLRLSQKFLNSFTNIFNGRPVGTGIPIFKGKTTVGENIFQDFRSMSTSPSITATENNDTISFSVNEEWLEPKIPKDRLKTVQGGVNISINNTDPLNPIISAMVNNFNYIGILSTTDTPPATGSYYGKVDTAGTYTNFLDSTSIPILFTNLELENNFGFISIVNNVATKSLNSKPEFELLDESVTVDKTNFITESFIFGVNRFDKTTITPGHYVNAANGVLAPNVSYSSSDYIYIKDTTNITVSNLIHIAFYDSAKVYISGREFGGDTIAKPVGAVYCRVSIIDSMDLNTFQVESGTVKSTFTPYVTPISGKVIEGLLVDVTSLPNNLVTPENTTFARNIKVFSRNRFDKNTVTFNFYVNATTGLLASNPAYVASDFIEVKDLAFITMTQLIHIAFYNEDKVFISGREFGGDTIAVPINAKFCRVSIYNDGSKNTFQLEPGEAKTMYVDYITPVNKVFIENLLLEEPIENTESIFFANPSLVYTVQNRPIDFIFESFIIPKLGNKLSDYYVSSFGYRGKFLQDRSRLIPTDDSDYLFKVEKFPNVSEEKYTAIKCAPITNGTGVTVKVLYLGDSTVNNGHLIKEINDYFLLDPMNVNFVGTRNTGGINHEGRSGWTFNNYFTQASISGVANPFFNGTTFSFSHYLTTTGITLGANDWFFIQLGINDLYSVAGSLSGGDVDAQVTAVDNYLSQMITQIHAHNPGIRIGVIMTTPPAISQDATGNLLNNSFYSSEYYLKKGLVKLWKKMLDTYDNIISRDNKIYLIPCNMTIDRVNGYNTAEVDVSPFNPKKIIQQIDDVHLSPIGYKEQATPVIGAIKYLQ